MDIYEEAFVSGFETGLEKVAKVSGKDLISKLLAKGKKVKEGAKKMWGGGAPKGSVPYKTSDMIKELRGKGIGRVSKGKAARVLGTRAGMVAAPVAVAGGIAAAAKKKKKEDK